MKKKSNLWDWVLAVSLFGILLALYLLWQQFFRPAFQPCNVSSLINCNAIISGPVSSTLGIPTPFYGLIGYIIIFFSALYQKKKILLGTATFGLLFCLWIGYREIFQLAVLCPVCILCDVAMILLFSFAIFLQKKQ